MKNNNRIHPSHQIRFSDASSFDLVCEKCLRTDHVPGGLGKLVEPCPQSIKGERAPEET